MNERIRELRVALGMTQAAFSRSIGLSRAAIADIENGRNAAYERHIRLILSAFPRVNEAWLRDGEGPMFLEDTKSTRSEVLQKKYDFRAVLDKLSEQFAMLDPDQQAAVMKMTMDFIASVTDGDELAPTVPAVEPDPEEEQEDEQPADDVPAAADDSMAELLEEAERFKQSFILQEMARRISSASITADIKPDSAAG